MKKKLLHKVKQNKAFTLMELLIVVAITVVLLGISIVGISNLVKNLKMAELDEYAKEIYLEAQNQIGVIEVEGALGTYHKEIRDRYPASDDSDNVRFLKEIYALDERPSDYPEDADVMWEQMCYLKKSDDLAAKLVSHSSDIYINGGSYLIEFNPQTGDIYSVFYWESDEEITYDTVLSLDSRDRADRMDANIGYYGGMVAGDLTKGSELDMNATLINGEELYLKVSFVNTEEILSFYHTALDISITIKGENGNVVTMEHMDLSNAVHTLDTLDFYFLLDSMQEGMHFDDIVNAGLAEDKKIIPGENITIDVDCYFSHESGLWKSQTDIAGNSLFGLGTEGDTICISSVRHMVNLNEQYYDNELFSNAKKKITFISNIDFDEPAYAWSVDELGNAQYVGSGNGTRPIQYLSPITNASLFTNATVTGKTTTAKYILQNFVVLPESNGVTENVGIFSVTENVSFSNIHIVDITVNAPGYTNVGSLVGLMKGGSIDDCGVYLSTSGVVNRVHTDYCKMNDTAEGCNHNNEMEHRYDSYKVTGKNNVGGLVGSITGVADVETAISNSFAAVKVESTRVDGSVAKFAGGFVGLVENTAGNKNIKIENTYASGDVIGEYSVGGFAGNVSANQKNIVLSNLYATGDVYAEQYFGGFLGESYYASFENCISYGHVAEEDVLRTGTDVLAENDYVGGFVSAERSVGNDYVDCVYMTQNGYNTEIVLEDPHTILKKTYGELLADTTMAADPYKVDLYLQAFPFETLPNQTIHYGNWPEPFVIDTSLVYYERYADSSYGYYCITTISENNNIWVLNTLKDESCVEDGYGLLTKYNLEEIDYNLYVGTEDTVSSSGTASIVTQSMVQNGTSSDGKFIRLNQQGSLEFYAIDKYNAVSGREGQKTGETFEVSRLYLYQLPYELQCTERMNVKYFYDRLEISAKAYGSETKVINGLSYLYCPHFARTAVNPNVNETEPIEDYQAEHASPTNIFIRSARQLNALGRFPYYWNDRGGLENSGDIVYIQETDINFSTYVKEYAGRDFDLQAFGKEYSNRPIGDPDLAATDTYYYNAQFNNTYDGRSNKIIDYCVEGAWIDPETKESNYTQFTGLFGEIKGAVLKNIVMVVSSNPQGNGGLITSSFRIDGSTSNRPWEGQSVKRAGVGALVGLAYETSATSSRNQIINCVASGYTVEYKMTKTTTGVQPLGIAVGGLAGFSMSNMSNCAATNDVVMSLERDYIFEKQGTVFLGGFAGSYYFGTIRDCYSGGTISVVDDDSDDSKIKYGIARLRIGTFCPGWMDTPSDGLSWKSDDVEYFGIYSITEVDMDVWKVKESAGGTGTAFTHFIPLVSRMVVCEDDTLGWIGDIILGKKWTTDKITGMTVRSVGAKHITDLVKVHLDKISGVSKSSPPKEYFMQNGSNGQTSSDFTLAGLKTLTEKNTNGVEYDFSYRASFSYLDGDLELSIANYPYPEVIYEVDANGNKTNTYVHYGKWSQGVDYVTTRFPAYYEKYADGKYGFLYLREDGTKVDSLLYDNSKEIVETGYAELTLDKNQNNVVNVAVSITDVDSQNAYTYYLAPYDRDYLFSVCGAGLENKGKNLANVKLPYQYTQVKVENGKIQSDETATIYAEWYLNPYYGAALSTNENLGKVSGEPLQVRTYEQLSNLSKTTVTTFAKQTYNITLKPTDSPVNVNASTTLDGNGYVIKNASNSVFVKNAGNVHHLSVQALDTYNGSAVENNKAYGLAVENTGTISYSYVVGTVTGVEEAAGFVGKNTGTISNCYTNTNVIANGLNGKAAAFAISSSNTVKSYAVGAVTAHTTYGFMESGEADTCYTIVNQNGVDMYGFANASSIVNNCYWGYDYFRNYNVAAGMANQGVGTRARLVTIQSLADYDTDYADVPNNTSLGTNCPYPSVGLVHYGDWPVATRFNNSINSSLASSGERAGVFYYEVYVDEVDGSKEYGIYALDYSDRWDGSSQQTINTLMTEKPFVPVESGFGVYASDSGWRINWNGWTEMRNVGTAIDLKREELKGYSFRYLTGTENGSITLEFYYNAILDWDKTLTISLTDVENARN